MDTVIPSYPIPHFWKHRALNGFFATNLAERMVASLQRTCAYRTPQLARPANGIPPKRRRTTLPGRR